MTRIGFNAVAFTSLVLTGLTFGAIAPAVAAPCEQWQVGGRWKALQSNKTVTYIYLQQTGTELRGKGNYRGKLPSGASPDFFGPRGPIDGSIRGNSIEFSVFWDGGSVGVYTGTIGESGRIEGTTYDKRHPQTKAAWYSDVRMQCAVFASPASAEPPAKPAKALGRIHTTTPANDPPICARARSARARNSPAAPGLETQCRSARIRARAAASKGSVKSPFPR